MSILLDRNTAIATTSPFKWRKSPPKPQKKRLVARWLRDENNQLYCRWVTEYEDRCDRIE